MRIRLFLSFAIVMLLTLLILGSVIRTDTETTIASFAQSGGFYGADRVISQYADYYAENGSWDGITMSVASENPSDGWDGTGSGRGKGGGGGGSRQDGSGSAMGFSNQDQFSLATVDGVVLLSTSLSIGDKLSEDVLANGFEILVENEVVGYLLPDGNMLDLSDVISEKLSDSLSESLLPTALIASAAAIILSIILAAFLMNPIRQLTKAANRVASGDLSQRVPVSGRDEISQLAESFNQSMAGFFVECVRRNQICESSAFHIIDFNEHVLLKWVRKILFQHIFFNIFNSINIWI